VSPLVLIVPSPAVGAPRVFQSFRAGIRWGVGSPLLDISLSDDPSIVSDASSSNDNLPLVPTEPPPSSTDTSNHKPNSSHCATSRDILWIDRYCSTRVGFVVRHSHRPPARLLEFSRLKLNCPAPLGSRRNDCRQRNPARDHSNWVFPGAEARGEYNQ